MSAVLVIGQRTYEIITYCKLWMQCKSNQPIRYLWNTWKTYFREGEKLSDPPMKPRPPTKQADLPSSRAFFISGHSLLLCSLCSFERSSENLNPLPRKYDDVLAAFHTESLQTREMNWIMMPLGLLSPCHLAPRRCTVSTASASLPFSSGSTA